MRIGFAALAVLALGCSGDEKECTEYELIVTVTTPTGDEVVTDAIVELSAVIDGQVVDSPCPSNGDGTYTCHGPMDSDNQQISALPGSQMTGMFMSSAMPVAVPETCDKPITATLALAQNGGA